MLKVGVRTALGLLAIGGALIGYGAYLIFPPAALILVGIAVISFALFGLEV